MELKFLLCAVLIGTFFVHTSAFCLFIVRFNEYYCELQNVNASSTYDMIDVSGQHIGGRTNDHVNIVEVSRTSFLTEIPVVIFLTFRNLETFRLPFNVVTRIDLPFCGPRMKEFVMFENLVPIPILQNGAFRGCTSLEEFLVWGTNIQQVEENAFSDLPRLRELFIVNNSFTEIHSHWFRQQHQLEVLRLDFSSIVSIEPGTFQCKEFLHDLDLRNNRLERIVTGTFTNMPRLRTLHLGDNNIQVFEEGAFANLPLLEFVELVNSQLTVLDSNIFGTTLPNLRHLGVGSNQINAIDRALFRRLPALRYFLGGFNVCVDTQFVDIESLEDDVFPYLEKCFSNFDNFLNRNTLN